MRDVIRAFISREVAPYALVTLAISVMAHRSRAQATERALMRTIQRQAPSQLHSIGARTNRLAIGWRMTLFSATVGLVAIARGEYVVLSDLMTLSLLRMTNAPLKQLFAAGRPDTEPDLIDAVTERAPGLGFPSGHTMSMTLVCGVVVRHADRLVDGEVARTSIRVGACGLITMTGMGRIMTGAHWPSDVVGGWCWAVLILRLRRNHSTRSRGLR